MTWYKKTGKSPELVISTRARLARNITGIPFPSRLTPEKAIEVISLVEEAMGPVRNDFSLIRVDKLSHTEQQALVEQHLISTAFASGQLPRALFVNAEHTLSIMVNEEDHLRIQCITSGLDPETALRDANRIDDLLSERLNFAFHEKYGYLTACPTNAGTGLRISAMLHLPALAASGAINNLLSQTAKSGFAVRGMYGEGSDAEGNFYQLSNQVTLGISEEEILARFGTIIRVVADAETSLRSKIQKDLPPRLADKLMRSYGTLKYCRMLSGKEMINFISDVRFGIYLGIIPDIGFETLNEIMVTAMPANITGKGEDMSPEQRDQIRARAVNSIFGKE
ncbi:MAG: protein arginine kinase [Clostridia bacterium]|nr:protein arginine kinase [Clostridia bacterium]